MNHGNALNYSHYCAIAAMAAGALFGRGHWAWGIFVLFFCYHFDRKMQDALFGEDEEVVDDSNVE